MSAEKQAAKKKSGMYYVHCAIGLGIMVLFFFLPPFEPITPLGMKVVGIFLMMIYSWSMVGTLWPSILGLAMLGAIGANGDGGSNAVWLNAVGNYTVILVLFGMVLFGAVDYVGLTTYIARFFLTRKVFAGRPFVFFAIFFTCCGVISGLLSPILGLILLWPIATRTMDLMGVTKEDKVWRYFFVGMFLCMTLMQPLFPFKGAALVPVSAFEAMMNAAGTPEKIAYLPYMLTDIIMTTLVMTIYILGLKFVIRPDVTKIKSITPEMVAQQFDLPPMNLVQKCYLWMIPVYLCVLILPGFFKGVPFCDLLTFLGPLGCTAFFVVAFLIIKVDGQPLLNFKEVAYKAFDWGIFFMIAAAVYAAGLLSKPTVGFSSWLIQTLNPILGGQPEMVFVFLMFLTALIITNFANNAAMAVVLMPVAVGFSNQMGIDALPVAVGIILMVFVAMLTPAASPHAGMMHGNKNIYTTRDIMMIGLPMCGITLLAYTFIGYPLIKFMFSIMG